MSIRARYETSTETLLISRGALFVTARETGVMKEHSISGNIAYDKKTRMLNVPVITISVDRVNNTRDVLVTPMSFKITKDPAQIRAEMRAKVAKTEEPVRKLIPMEYAPQPTSKVVTHNPYDAPSDQEITEAAKPRMKAKDRRKLQQQQSD